MSNHLKNAASPYLLQHAENPVDWYPWRQEAFERAKKEDKPIFLSIGYSTCHWCHVMAHESFEDQETAEILNQSFISIKVDREERPDIDSVYMSVCQAFTGSGGWPMSIFMTWDKKPFLAGTYFPVQAQYGIPGFPDLLRMVAERWRSSREELFHAADQIVAQLRQASRSHGDASHRDLPKEAAQIFSRSFDSQWGGFGDAPKFPAPHNLLFLMLYAKQNKNKEVLGMVEKTLLQMRLGGLFDQIGYGFSRYSTDRRFLAPHFEKMLYDNALLIMVYVSAYGITKNPIFLDTAEKTAQYALREMASPDGGFYSAQDADSDGVEGKYYTFTYDEVMEVLGREKGGRFTEAFDVTEEGNFEGANIPNLLKSHAIGSDFGQEIRQLHEYRKSRSKLHLDDKILISWNSLMIAALSMLSRVSKDGAWLQAAVRAEQFLDGNLRDGLRLFTSWRHGRPSKHNFLDDYAFYAAALTELYHSTLDKGYLDKAEQFCQEAKKRFADGQGGGFFLSGQDSEELFMNPKETYDGAIPSGNSVMAYNYVRLFQLTQKEKYQELAKKQIHYMSGQAQDYPAGHSMFLVAQLLFDSPPAQIAIVLKEDWDLEAIKGRLPLLANVAVVPESKERPLVNGKATFYVCRNHVCLAPSNAESALLG